MEIPDHLTCLLRNLYAGQEATVRTRHGTTDWFQIGKGVHQGCILSPCLFNLYAEYIMGNARLDEAQASYTAWKCIQGYIFYALYHHLFLYLYSIYPSIHPPIVCQKEIQRTLLDMDILLNEKQNVHKLSEIQKLIKGWFTK